MSEKMPDRLVNPMTAPETGFGRLRCPVCPVTDEPDSTAGAVYLSLVSLDAFYCDDCGATFTRADVRAMLDGLIAAAVRWSAVLAWVDGRPPPSGWPPPPAGG